MSGAVLLHSAPGAFWRDVDIRLYPLPPERMVRLFTTDCALLKDQVAMIRDAFWRRRHFQFRSFCQSGPPRAEGSSSDEAVTPACSSSSYDGENRRKPANLVYQTLQMKSGAAVFSLQMLRGSDETLHHAGISMKDK
ncbi:hypothetical protein NXC12_PD00447 (plasmid) [Rhizobium etli]|uniref:Uncharacterized protein n=1 Tax=Rhizobium etli TaxID=29449 RepID=A0AAN1BLN3_RHIET|nr:hypothetical protein NXC12_PD00447 [Rhizobium etli]